MLKNWARKLRRIGSENEENISNNIQTQIQSSLGRENHRENGVSKGEGSNEELDMG